MRTDRPSPRRRIVRAAGAVAAAALAACAALPAACPAAAITSAAAGDVFYSPRATVVQAKSPAGMRAFLSSDHPEYDLQSYVWAGSLVEAGGRLDTFAFEMQRNGPAINSTAILPVVTSAALFNRSSSPGYVVGALTGVPELTLPFSLTSRPWSVRAQSFTPGELPQFLDARVVSGALGTRGAEYEFTTYVPNFAAGAPVGEYLTLYVRVRDTTGLMQWGYGPSGFFPQWIYPSQRAAVMDEFGGSVGKYLAATHDPMTDQGDYYYTLPLLKVERFVASLGDEVVGRGSSGWIWFDNVEQSYDAAALDIVKHDITWMEFSVQFPSTGQAMKIGFVEQETVGRLSYAMLHDADSPRARNGAFTNSVSWDVDDVHITPVETSLWTSPASGEKYYTQYRVTLDGPRPGQRARLLMTARFDDQEVIVGQRTVYEGLFSARGTLCGKKVSGQAWTEVQPAGQL